MNLVREEKKGQSTTSRDLLCHVKRNFEDIGDVSTDCDSDRPAGAAPNSFLKTFQIYCPPPVKQTRRVCTPRSSESLSSRVPDIDAYIDSECASFYDPTYAWTIYCTMKKAESSFFQTSLKSEDEFYDIQSEITPFMHSTLVNWLIHETKSYIEPNAFCLGIHIMDDYIARVMVPVKKFQLLGCSCILLAAKLEQIVVPSVVVFVESAGKAFTKEDMVSMEQEVLLQTGFDLVRPTRQLFLNRYLLASKAELLQHLGGDRGSLFKRVEGSGGWSREECFAQMMLDITLQYNSFNQYRMSEVAAAIVHFTHQYFRPLDFPLWSPVMQHYTGIEEVSLVPIVSMLCDFYWNLRLSTFSSILTKFETNAMHRISVAVTARLPQSLRFDGQRRTLQTEMNSPQVKRAVIGDSEEIERRLLNCTPEPSGGAVSHFIDASPDELAQGGNEGNAGDDETTDTDEPSLPPCAFANRGKRTSDKESVHKGRPNAPATKEAVAAVSGIGLNARRSSGRKKK